MQIAATIRDTIAIASVFIPKVKLKTKTQTSYNLQYGNCLQAMHLVILTLAIRAYSLSLTH